MVQNQINNKIIEDSRFPNQFQVPIETNASTSEYQIGATSLENTKVRTIIKNLIGTCISSEDKELKSISIINDCDRAMIISREKDL